MIYLGYRRGAHYTQPERPVNNLLPEYFRYFRICLISGFLKRNAGELALADLQNMGATGSDLKPWISEFLAVQAHTPLFYEAHGLGGAAGEPGFFKQL
jgi:hypothetical protein